VWSYSLYGPQKDFTTVEEQGIEGKQ